MSDVRIVSPSVLQNGDVGGAEEKRTELAGITRMVSVEHESAAIVEAGLAPDTAKDGANSTDGA
jgi:hypothetical protein